MPDELVFVVVDIRLFCCAVLFYRCDVSVVVTCIGLISLGGWKRTEKSDCSVYFFTIDKNEMFICKIFHESVYENGFCASISHFCYIEPNGPII